MMIYISYTPLISRKHGDLRIAFTLARETIFEQTYNFCAIIWFFYVGYNQRLQLEINFILFCIFNYVTYYPLTSFIGKFRSSRENLVTNTT